MNIKITSKDGITLKTKDTYIREDISIVVDESILGGGLPIEVSSTEEMNAMLVETNIGKVYKYTGETTEEFIKDEIYIVVEGAE